MAEPKKGLSGLTESHSVVTQIWHLLCKQDVPLHDSQHKSEQMCFFPVKWVKWTASWRKKKISFTRPSSTRLILFAWPKCRGSLTSTTLFSKSGNHQTPHHTISWQYLLHDKIFLKWFFFAITNTVIYHPLPTSNYVLKLSVLSSKIKLPYISY